MRRCVAETLLLSVGFAGSASSTEREQAHPGISRITDEVAVSRGLSAQWTALRWVGAATPATTQAYILICCMIHDRRRRNPRCVVYPPPCRSMHYNMPGPYTYAQTRTPIRSPYSPQCSRPHGGLRGAVHEDPTTHTLYHPHARTQRCVCATPNPTRKGPRTKHDARKPPRPT